MIKDIEIVEYKGFENLKLENLSQVNIISGENNIGKTALLEALFIYEGISFGNSILFRLNPFLSIAKNRDITENRIKKYLRDVCFSVTTNELKINVNYKAYFDLTDTEKKVIRQQFNRDYDEFIVCYINNDIDMRPIDHINVYPEDDKSEKSYINSSKPINKKLVELYSTIQSKGLQLKFLTYLKLLDSDIEWIEPQLLDDEMLLRLNLNNPERSLLSSELGEGTNRYIEILCTLLSNSGGTVFIDEIENGIHYTKLYDIWKAILEIVEKEKIQLFVTTHNLESIEALNEASEAMSFDRIASVKLQKDENHVIYPVVRNYSSFVATVDSGMDIR